jgi:hypothetical protein
VVSQWQRKTTKKETGEVGGRVLTGGEDRVVEDRGGSLMPTGPLAWPGNGGGLLTSTSSSRQRGWPVSSVLRGNDRRLELEGCAASRGGDGGSSGQSVR